MAHPAQYAPHIRSIYRSVLRELPARPLSARSPLQQHIRDKFASPPSSAPSSPSSPSSSSLSSPTTSANVQALSEYVGYLRAQRVYATLLERYNPGMDMSDEERVRLSARRVGMNLPEDMSGAGPSRT